MKTRTKRKPEYKQMTFDTAIRNPERFKYIIPVIIEFENRVLDDHCLLEIVCKMYLQGIVSSKQIDIHEDTTEREIKEKVIAVNSTRNSDGGFPKGYQSRFWTYMRALSELGFVYAQYNEQLKVSNIAKDIVNNVIDDQQAFAVLSMLCNRKSPYRTILNDYNYFRFIFNVLIELRHQDKSMSYNQLLKLIRNFDAKTKIDGYEYTLKLKHIITENKLNDDIISKYILQMETAKLPIQFKYIPKPLQLEFFISLLIITKYGNEFVVKPNYKMDDLGLPISHAPGNKGDIEVYSDDVYWLIEVTLIKSRKQQINDETTNVIRHFTEAKDFIKYHSKYLSFVAPIIHNDTLNYYLYQIHCFKNKNVYIKTYTINEFVEITNKKTNLEDMRVFTELF
jgi:hypothetical protein